MTMVLRERAQGLAVVDRASTDLEQLVERLRLLKATPMTKELLSEV